MAEITKVCTKCGEAKPLTAYSRNKRFRDGCERRCKACRSEAFAAWRVKNLDRRREYQQEWYEKNPGAKAEHNRAYSAKHSADIVVRVAKWRRENPERVRATLKAHRAANRELYRERRQRPEFIVKKREADRLWNLANKEHASESTRLWRKNNPDRYRVINSRRKALNRAAPGSATIAQIQARVEYFGSKCWMCGAQWESIDHVKPLSKGGSNWPANLRPACLSCNSSKHAKWPFDLTLHFADGK